MREAGEKAFERMFGAGGVWPGLLRARSQGYIGTELKMMSAEERRYWVRDLWRSHLSFEVFRDGYQQDMERFRGWLADQQIVEREMFLGAFYSDEPDGGDDAGLVQA